MAPIPERSSKPPAPHPSRTRAPGFVWFAVLVGSAAGVLFGPLPIGMAIAVVVLASFLCSFWTFKAILDHRRHRIDDFETALGNLDIQIVRIPQDEPARWPIADAATPNALLGRDAWTLWRGQGLGDGLPVTIYECVLPAQKDHEENTLSPKLFSIVATVPCPDEWPEVRFWTRGIRLTFLDACSERDLRVGSDDFDEHWQVGRARAHDADIARGAAEEEQAADLTALLLSTPVQDFLMETDAHELWQVGAGAVTCLRTETVTSPRLVLPIQRVFGLIERLDPVLAVSIRTPPEDAHGPITHGPYA